MPHIIYKIDTNFKKFCSGEKLWKKNTLIKHLDICCSVTSKIVKLKKKKSHIGKIIVKILWMQVFWWGWSQETWVRGMGGDESKKWTRSDSCVEPRFHLARYKSQFAFYGTGVTHSDLCFRKAASLPTGRGIVGYLIAGRTIN